MKGNLYYEASQLQAVPLVPSSSLQPGCGVMAESPYRPLRTTPSLTCLRGPQVPTTLFMQ